MLRNSFLICVSPSSVSPGSVEESILIQHRRVKSTIGDGSGGN